MHGIGLWRSARRPETAALVLTGENAAAVVAACVMFL